MNIINDTELRRQIRSSCASSYLFFGEEDYLKLHAISLVRQSICNDPSLAVFNDLKLDSLTYSPAALLDMITALPMMADRKLITVTGLDFNAMKQGEFDELLGVLSQLPDYDYSTVIICADSDRFDPGFLPKRPSGMLSKLSEHLTPVQFEKSTPAKLAAWVGKHYEHNGVHADSDVCMFTVEYCGRDMFTLGKETDKISYYVLSQSRDRVTADDVRYIGSSVSEYDAFAFTNAISRGQKDAALSVLSEMKKKRTDPIFIMSEVARTVCECVSVQSLLSDGMTHAEISKVVGIHEYKVSLIAKSCRIKDPRALLLKCRRADIDIKTSQDGYEVLEKLICTM